MFPSLVKCCTIGWFTERPRSSSPLCILCARILARRLWRVLQSATPLIFMLSTGSDPVNAFSEICPRNELQRKFIGFRSSRWDKVRGK